MTVTTVQPQSPADLAGLKTGDRILRVNGTAPKGFIDFNELIINSEKTDLSLAIESAGGSREVTVRLMPEKDFFNAGLIQQMLGLRLQELTPKLAEHFLLSSTNGFLIAGVEEGTPAAEQLRPGYLVTGIDGQAPDDLVGAAKIVFAKKKGEPVKLDVTVQQQRGGFIYHVPGTIELPVR